MDDMQAAKRQTVAGGTERVRNFRQTAVFSVWVVIILTVVVVLAFYPSMLTGWYGKSPQVRAMGTQTTVPIAQAALQQPPIPRADKLEYSERPRVEGLFAKGDEFDIPVENGTRVDIRGYDIEAHMVFEGGEDCVWFRQAPPTEPFTGTVCDQSKPNTRRVLRVYVRNLANGRNISARYAYAPYAGRVSM